MGSGDKVQNHRQLHQGCLFFRFGEVDIIVNNAGYWELMDFVSYREDAMDRMFAVNVKGGHKHSPGISG